MVEFFIAMVNSGTFLPRWHPYGSRSSSSWRHFLAAMAPPRFADGARSFVSSVVANVGCCCVCVDGSDWHLKLSGRR